MLTAVFQLFAVVPILSVLLVIVAAWLLRRRPGRLRHAWIVGFGALLVAADEVEELPLPEANPEPAVKSPALPTHHTIEGGIGGGSFQTCSGPRRYGDVGAMYRYSGPISKETSLHVEAGTYAAWSGTASGGLRLSGGVEHRWVGASLGLVAGALERDTPLDVPALPTASLRVGPRDMFFVDAAFLQDSPAPLPGPYMHVGAGIAFPRLGNDWEPLTFRAGLSGLGVYVAPTIPVADNANVEFTAAYSDPQTWGVSGLVRVHIPAE